MKTELAADIANFIDQLTTSFYLILLLVISYIGSLMINFIKFIAPKASQKITLMIKGWISEEISKDITELKEENKEIRDILSKISVNILDLTQNLSQTNIHLENLRKRNHDLKNSEHRESLINHEILITLNKLLEKKNVI